MGKRKKYLWGLLILAGALLLGIGLSGCETCKGFGRDIQNLRGYDDWLREHYW